MRLVLYVIIIIGFFQGVLQIIGVPPTVFKIVIELFIYNALLISYAQTRKDFRLFSFPGKNIFIIYSLFVLFSAIINSSNLLSSFSFYRHTLNSYLFFISIYNYKFSEIVLRKIFKLIFFLAILQPIASILKYILIGQSEEYIGTIAVSGGSYSTLVPLFAITILISLYINYKYKTIYLLLSLGFVFLAFAGDKRAFWFFLPIILLILFILKRKYFFKKFGLKSFFKGTLFIVIFGSAMVFLGASMLPSLNPDHKIGGKFDFNYLTDYIQNYNTGEMSEVEGVGRMGGTVSLFSNRLNSELLVLLLGEGPDTFVNKNNESYNPNDYDVYLLSQYTGLMHYIISIGIFGTFFIIILYSYFLKRLFKIFSSKRKYTQFYSSIFLSLIVINIIFFIDFFLYTKTFVHSNILNILFFLFLGIIFNPNNLNYFYEDSVCK